MQRRSSNNKMSGGGERGIVISFLSLHSNECVLQLQHILSSLSLLLEQQQQQQRQNQQQQRTRYDDGDDENADERLPSQQQQHRSSRHTLLRTTAADSDTTTIKVALAAVDVSGMIDDQFKNDEDVDENGSSNDSTDDRSTDDDDDDDDDDTTSGEDDHHGNSTALSPSSPSALVVEPVGISNKSHNTSHSTTAARTTKPMIPVGVLQSDINPSILRKQIDTLTHISFPIPSKSAIRTVLQFPLFLLSKEQIQLSYEETVDDSRRTVAHHQKHQQQQLRCCQMYTELVQSVHTQQQPIIVLLIRSGRFAGGVFDHHGKCTHHTTSVRYTVRKGQGKSQSSQDNQNSGKTISIGSQLRRQGEIQLRQDIQATIQEWKLQFQTAVLIFISIPRTMEKGLYNATNSHIINSNANQHQFVLQKHDPRIRHIPLDVGRPTFAAVGVMYTILTTVTIRELSQQQEQEPLEPSATSSGTSTISASSTIMRLKIIETDEINDDEHDIEGVIEMEQIVLPLSEWHIAARNGNTAKLEALLESLLLLQQGDDEQNKTNDTTATTNTTSNSCINEPAGIYQRTPLHYAVMAAEVNDLSGPNPPTTAAAAATCIRLLLEQGRANPCIVDSKDHVPYYYATENKNDTVRDAFRISRSILGEDYCDWDSNGARVGTPLTLDILQAKMEKEAEKRRKKRLKQKEKKIRDKVEADAAEQRRIAMDEQKQKEDDAKRIRDGLQPKLTTTAGGKACDFCQTICVGKKRINMFQRLQYYYCTSQCLQHHKRELMAVAATARLNQSTN